jgi:site-specific recombinase XerD
LLHRKNLAKLDPQGFHEYLRELRARLAASTCHVRVMACRSFYTSLIVRRQRRTDPTVGITVRVRRDHPPIPYSLPDLSRLLSACTMNAPTLTLRNRALLLAYIGCGGRRTEVLSLRADQIDWTRATLLVVGKGAKRRELAPGHAAMAALRQYLGARTGSVWLSRYGTPLARSSAWGLLRTIARRAGVRGAYFHRFRHTYALDFLKESRDLMALRMILGHESYEMVERYLQFESYERALMAQRTHSLADRLSA